MLNPYAMLIAWQSPGRDLAPVIPVGSPPAAAGLRPDRTRRNLILGGYLAGFRFDADATFIFPFIEPI